MHTCECVSSEAVDPSSEALLLLPDINTYTYVYPNIYYLCVEGGMCVFVLPAECDLEFLESVLGMCRIRCRHRHIHIEYIFPFSLTYTKHNFTCSFLFSCSFSLSFYTIFALHFTLFLSVYFVSSIFPLHVCAVCSIQLFVKLNIYYRIQTIFVTCFRILKNSKFFSLLFSLSFSLFFHYFLRIVLDLVFVDFCRHFFYSCLCFFAFIV